LAYFAWAYDVGEADVRLKTASNPLWPCVLNAAYFFRCVGELSQLDYKRERLRAKTCSNKKLAQMTIQSGVIARFTVAKIVACFSARELALTNRQQFVFGKLPGAIVRARRVNSRANTDIRNVRRKSFA
jgi:hypothetical protein